MLLVRLASAVAPPKLGQVKLDWIADHHSDAHRFDATIEALVTLGVLKIEGDETVGLLTQLSIEDADERQAILSQCLFKWLSASPFRATFAEAVQRVETAEGQLVLDTHRLPLQLNWFRHLLRELGIFSRSESPRFWNGRDDAQDAILGMVRGSSRRRANRRKLSNEELQLMLALREERAKDAEDWVVKREHRRLAGHPLVDLIRRISEEDVAAGYDVESFSSQRVLTFDRHIEVKSFKGSVPRFFWSRNEIEVAKSLGESYVLVLVNIDRIADPNYDPQEITDPYYAISKSDDWIQLPAATEFRLKRPSAPFE